MFITFRICFGLSLVNKFMDLYTVFSIAVGTVLRMTFILGMVDRDRHRGRPPRRWVDDIVDWCGRPLPADREEWRRVIIGLNGSQGP